VFAEINAWWQDNRDAGRPSMLACYSFGKAQRILSGLAASIGPIIVHGAVEPLNRAYREAGVHLPETKLVSEVTDKADIANALVLCPPSASASPWANRFKNASVAFASGWMQLRGRRRMGGYDRGFVLSDHADWPGLQSAIRGTGASRVIVTHGYEAVMTRWLTEQGLEAGSFKTEYGDDAKEATLDVA
jgi:putative mRNA 3-end processing factor